MKWHNNLITSRVYYSDVNKATTPKAKAKAKADILWPQAKAKA